MFSILNCAIKGTAKTKQPGVCWCLSHTADARSGSLYSRESKSAFMCSTEHCVSVWHSTTKRHPASSSPVTTGRWWRSWRSLVSRRLTNTPQHNEQKTPKLELWLGWVRINKQHGCLQVCRNVQLALDTTPAKHTCMAFQEGNKSHISAV